MNHSSTLPSCLVPLIDLKAQFRSIRKEIHDSIDNVLVSQNFILGPEVRALEAEIAQYCGTRFAVAVASGTDALILALRCCGVGPGDEVIVPSFTFIATADSVSLLGATPVFADIQEHTFTLDPSSVLKKLSRRTRAIVPVHLYGQCCDMDPLLNIARHHDIRIIEDNAQALGASYRGKKAGARGDLGCISFFPSKNLGAYGDGGMVVTDSEEFCHRLRSLRAHGSTFRLYEIGAPVTQLRINGLQMDRHRVVNCAHNSGGSQS